MFHGSIVALVTPMTSNSEVDYDRLRHLVAMHLDQGTDGIVVIGTTGEAGTLTEAEQEKIIKITIEMVADRIPVIVGTGTIDTKKTIEKTQKAMDLGADACLLITPYCVKPTQEGLYQHYKAVAEAVAIPIILYNVSGRTACDLLPETVKRLSQFSNIVAIKEANGDLKRGRELQEACGDSLDLLSGDDASAMGFIQQGGKGVISVTANVAPKMMHEMCKAALEGNTRLAEELNNKLMPLHNNLFVEANPIPVKWALQQMKCIGEGIRLPLTPLSLKYHAVVQEAMKQGGVL
jgi:4-hydroxy-tetrahydrodipicolinate synthase